jgi:transcriptional regulator with XRE-family HTH domain
MTEFDEKATIGRIRVLRERVAGPRGKSGFARAIGISPSTYAYYEKDRLPPVDILLRICEVSDTDLYWLLTGRSWKLASAGVCRADLSKTGPELAGKTCSLMEKLDRLLADSPESAEAVLAFVELLSEKRAVQAGPAGAMAAPKGERPGWVPVLGRTAAGMVHFWEQTTLPAAGAAVRQLEELVEKHTGRPILGSKRGHLAVDLQARPLVKALGDWPASLVQVSAQMPDEVAEFVDCPELRDIFPDCFALRIDGDSMSPRINDGELVIVSPSVPAAQGQVAIVRLAGQIGVTCKLVRSTETEVHLIPINEKYEPRVVLRAQLVWALAVLCHMKF